MKYIYLTQVGLYRVKRCLNQFRVFSAAYRASEYLSPAQVKQQA
jgi:hypothetical protein